MIGDTEAQLAGLYYHIARDAAGAVTTEDSAFKLAQYGAIAAVFSALCLEALANQLYPEGEDEELSVEEKWALLPEVFGAVEGYDRGRAPFQSFKVLLNRRNRLVHFKSEQERLSDTGQRNFIADLLKDPKEARRWIDTVEGMIRELDRLTGGRSGIPSFLGGQRYLYEVWAAAGTPVEWLSEVK